LRGKGNTIIVQCKGHDKPVGPAALRELYDALLDCGAERAILASVSGFTKGARDFATGKPLRLLGLADIVSMAAEVRGEGEEGAIRTRRSGRGRRRRGSLAAERGQGEMIRTPSCADIR
jgi:hypothetical protein